MSDSIFGRELYDRVLQRTDDPIERSKEVLLWRGFPVKREGDTLYLAKGVHPYDIAMLERFTDVIEEDNRTLDTCARIMPFARERRAFALFSARSRNGMTGPFDWGGHVEDDWAAFHRLRFGVKVPVKHLDPGIALLVKILPLLGLHTVMSCDGHTEKAPIIHFMSEYHWKWAQVALPQFLPMDDAFVRQWTFKEDDRGWLKHQWLLASGGCGPDIEAQYALYANIQRLCRSIMFSGLAPRARETKQNMRGPDDLYNHKRYRFSDTAPDLTMLRTVSNRRGFITPEMRPSRFRLLRILESEPPTSIIHKLRGDKYVGKRGESYPFSMHNGHIVADMGRECVLIDTGSPFSLCREDEKNGGGTLDPLARQMGGISLEKIGEFVGCEVEALAGCDILNRYDVTIDPVKRRLILYSEIQPFGGEAYDAEFALGVPILDVTVRGEKQRLCFDTGAQLSYLPESLIQGLESAGQRHDFSPLLGLGTFAAQTARVPITLAGENIDILCGANDKVQALLRMANITGVLGSAVFTHFKVHLSARTQKICFRAITYDD